MIKIFFLQKKGIINNFKQIINILPPEEAAEVNRKVRNTDKEITLLSKIMARTLLAEHIKCNPLLLQISKGKYGKPYLPQNPHFHYNVSHAGSILCLAIADSEIGVDIEEEKNIEEAVMQFSCTEEEYNQLKSTNSENRISSYFKTWCLKESFLKAIGTGLFRQLKSFSIIENKDKQIKLKDYEDSENSEKWKFHYERVLRNYHFSLCSSWSEGNIEKIWITQKDLISKFINKAIE